MNTRTQYLPRYCVLVSACVRAGRIPLGMAETRAGITLAELCTEIEKRGGEEYVWERIADGDSVRTVARSFGASRGLFYKWIGIDRDRRMAALDEARRASAEAHIDRGTEILEAAADRPGLTSAEASIAAQRAGWHKWLATVRDREQFGEQKAGVNLQLNVGQLHLAALRAAGGPNALPSGGEQAAVIEAEIVEEGV